MAAREKRITVGRRSGDVRGSDNRAIQIAIDAVSKGGGTVEVLPGTYVCHDAVHLRSGVRLVGAGERTVLRRADGFRVPMLVSADYGQWKITPADITPFRVGQGLYVRDKSSGGWLDSVVTVRRVEGGSIHFDEPLVMDYSEENGGEVVASGAVISGVDVEDCVVEGLVLDGNKAANHAVGGCQSGCLYFHRASRVTIADVAVRDFAGDGISFQTTRDFTLERVKAAGCTNFGLHPGTGSTRIIIRDGEFVDNEVGGFFLCWRVQESRFERLICERNGGWGINIGHKDTDNVFADCTVSKNAAAGIIFRAENARNGGHRNRFERCRIEDNGGAGIEVTGHVYDVAFEDCRIAATRGKRGRQRVGILLGEHARRFRSTGCTWLGHSRGNVVDKSGRRGAHSLDA